MKRAFIYFILFGIFLDCKAQLILTHPVDIHLAEFNFNPKVILATNIKSINIFTSEKPDGEIIIDKGEEEIYRFNKEGYLRRYTYPILNHEKTEEVNKLAAKKNKNKQAVFIFDQVNMYVFYDIKNQTIAKRFRTGALFHTYYFEYYKQGQIRKEYHCNETNTSKDAYLFQLGKQTLLSYNLFEYINLTNKQIKKNYLNENLDVYKKGIINYDDNRNKISESAEYIVSCKRNEHSYDYDQNNRLIKHTFESNENGILKTESIYTYDGSGNLLSENKITNDVLTNEIQYLYDSGNKLVKTQINRDHSNATVIIKKFTYSYH